MDLIAYEKTKALEKIDGCCCFWDHIYMQHFFHWLIGLSVYPEQIFVINIEVQNFQVTNSSYEIELRKMKSFFELLTRKLLYKLFFKLLIRLPKTFYSELLWLKFSSLNWGWKMKSFTWSYKSKLINIKLHFKCY